MDSLTEINSWIVDHKELITVLAVPLISWLVTRGINSSAEKRAFAERKLERELAKRMKLADFRQAWIIQMREDFSRLIPLTLNSSDRSNADKTLANEYAARIRMSLNQDEPEASEVLNAMNDTLTYQGGEYGEKENKLNIEAHRYLKAEWDRLKQELNEIDSLGGAKK